MYFAFGVRKSGSSIFNNIINAMAQMNGIKFVDVAGPLFQHGLRVPEWQSDPELSTLLRPGNVYGGFRNFPLGIRENQAFRDSKKVFLVRDPRDALVSEYFSNAYSHSVPAQGQAREDMLHLREQARSSEIDSYVLKMAPLLHRTLQQYRDATEDSNFKVFRYEDIILNKRLLLEGVAEFFGWSISEQQINQILGWADVIPHEERPLEFVRRVVPGDHQGKLSSATIERLNGLFAGEISYYRYN